MFYVIDRSTLRKWLVGMLLTALVLWLGWHSLSRDSVFKSGGEGIVFWRQSTPSWQMNTPTAPVMTEGDVPEAMLEVEAPTTWQKTEADVLDEYLPMQPIYGSDFQLAIPATGQLAVAVEPLTKREAFAEFRWGRDRSRSRQLEAMQQIMADATSSQQQRESAQTRLMDIMSGSEVETELEGLLMAQGLPDAVVVLGENGATVMVDTVLTEEEAARIGDTVSGMTGVTLEKIRIIDQRS